MWECHSSCVGMPHFKCHGSCVGMPHFICHGSCVGMPHLCHSSCVGMPHFLHHGSCVEMPHFLRHGSCVEMPHFLYLRFLCGNATLLILTVLVWNATLMPRFLCGECHSSWVVGVGPKVIRRSQTLVSGKQPKLGSGI